MKKGFTLKYRYCRNPTLVRIWCRNTKNHSVCVSVLSEREREEGAPGGSERKTEGSHFPTEDPAGRPGALRLSGGQLRLAAAVCRHGETEGGDAGMRPIWESFVSEGEK